MRGPTGKTVVVWSLALLFVAVLQPDSIQAQEAQETPEPGEVVIPQEWADDEMVEAPRRVVAMLIREALKSPQNQEAWVSLAQALPELGEEEEGEAYVRLLRASQIADSVALAAALAGTSGASSGGPGGWEATVRDVLFALAAVVDWTVEVVVVWVVRYDLHLVMILSALLIGLILLKGREPWAQGGRIRRARTTPAGEHLLREGTSRGVDTARALWASGLPLHEISRRTGLAQDALAVMLSLQRSSRA